MFLAEKAPDWKEGDCCNRCRTKFGMVNRQVKIYNIEICVLSHIVNVIQAFDQFLTLPKR